MPSVARPSARRILALVVPPVDELDLVGPLQVFNPINRLAGRTIYEVEVVTSGSRMALEGESGVLTFVARCHFSEAGGACDSVLLVCGLGSRSTRDAALSGPIRSVAIGRRSTCPTSSTTATPRERSRVLRDSFPTAPT